MGMPDRLEKPKSVVELAARLSSLGYWPVPIPSGCKGPSIPGWQNLKLTPDLVADYFKEGDGMLVGILHNNVLALDVDVYDAELSRKISDEALRRFPGALLRVGQPPKSALFLRMEEPGFKVHNTEKHEVVTEDGEVISAQVEVRSVSRQIVVYGKHPSTGKPYTWPNGELWATPRQDLPEASQDDIERFRDWCDDAIRKWAGLSDKKIIDLGTYAASGFADEKASEDQFRAALSHVSSNVGHDEWVHSLMAIHDFYEGSQAGLQVAHEWSSSYPNYSAREVETKWKSFELGKGVTYRTIFHKAKLAGADMSAIARIGKPEPLTLQKAGAGDDSEDWRANLVTNSRGRVVFNTANALLILQNDDHLKNCFAFDEFQQVKILTSPIPGTNTPRASFKGREMRDHDVINLVAHFNRNGFPDASKSVVADAIDAVCAENTYHPVRNYIADLPEWDGTERLSHWLIDYCNAEIESEEHEKYIQQAGRKWLISCVARILGPGAKADCVLILEGRQGYKKSTTFRVLAGAEWFGDSLPPMHTKDASDYIRGKWIIELAELSNMNKAEVEVVKAFISREEERFRPAYGRNEIIYPRQCVFAGTTNKSDYLRDETGNRRFWPVRIADKCDTDSLKADRDQIWAEAVAAYRGGEKWWLPDEVEWIARKAQDARVAQDAWEGDVLEYAGKTADVSATEIAENALGFDKSRIDRATTNRITAILTANGWKVDGRFGSGPNKGRSRYVKA